MFQVHLVDDEDLFVWEVAIFGPPGTLYEGGYFKARMNFPTDYPYNPPSVKFITDMWHPNIYPSGDVCISILHSPGHDEQSGELPSERWNPTQSVRTILLSIISLLNEPNTSSPANVDASVMYRKWQEKKDSKYMNKVLNQVAATMEQAEEDGVSVPSTVEEYTTSGKSTDHDELEAMDELDDDYGYMEVEDYEDDMEDYDCDEDQSEEEEEEEANGADGNSAVIATSTDNANATSAADDAH